ncbi:aspartate aminotransferase, cytoplasmic [Drosophila busckii]|nr:aspartate aminotransferase, cytoplasmic [Drosophila busckii]XP_017841286.1 aspartate aminotransferase, cytoplasmic [Drosophila busckii]
MVLGKDSKALKEKRTLSVQTISGTGGIRLAAEFMCQHLQRRTVFVPNPTWENHMKIFKQAGFKHIKQYKYWNAKKRKLDMSSILRELSEAPEGAVVLMHASAHNPTGMDPSKAQWHQIAELIKQRRLFPFFDCAYQGFASGDIESDAFAIRHFVDAGLETILVQSFAKNMGLYNERVGNLVVVLNDKQQLPAVASQFTILVRINYSNPPAFGSRVVHKVLSVEQNRKEWEQTVCMMASRVKDMRKQLADKLKQLDTPGTWDHIVQQTGMFSYTGLTPKHVQKLKDDKHIYMLSSGRANICGLTTKNVDYVAKSISEVVKELGATADADSECDS